MGYYSHTSPHFKNVNNFHASILTQFSRISNIGLLVIMSVLFTFFEVEHKFIMGTMFCFGEVPVYIGIGNVWVLG